LMKQAQYSPMSISEMAVTLYAADKGYFDDVEVKRALECEKAMIGYLKANCADLMNKMESTADLDGESEKHWLPALPLSRVAGPDLGERHG